MVSLSLMPVRSQAAEHGGQEHAGGTMAPAGGSMESGDTMAGQDQSGTMTGGDVTASASPPASAPPATPAPATPAPASPPALKPIVITFSGDLTVVNSGATPAAITVQDLLPDANAADPHCQPEVDHGCRCGKAQRRLKNHASAPKSGIGGS